MAEDKEKAVTTKSVMSEDQKKEVRKSQTAYKGTNHFDLVEVTIVKDSEYYRKDETDRVHPSMAAILEKKGLIASGWEKNVVERSGSEPMLTDVQVQEVLDGDRDINLPTSKPTPKK